MFTQCSVNNFSYFAVNSIFYFSQLALQVGHFLLLTFEFSSDQPKQLLNFLSSLILLFLYIYKLIVSNFSKTGFCEGLSLMMIFCLSDLMVYLKTFELFVDLYASFEKEVRLLSFLSTLDFELFNPLSYFQSWLQYCPRENYFFPYFQWLLIENYIRSNQIQSHIRSSLIMSIINLRQKIILLLIFALLLKSNKDQSRQKRSLGQQRMLVEQL